MGRAMILGDLLDIRVLQRRDTALLPNYLLFLFITLCQLFVVHIKIICCCCVCFQCTVLCCKDCSVLIANIHDVFTVRVSQQTSGPLAIHVNPGGVVSELITVTSVSAVSLSGFPVLQDTWYPGYINHHFVIISD